MRTLLAIAGFELRSRLKMPSTYAYFALYVAIAAFWMAAAGGAVDSAQISFGSEKVLINGPYALAQLLTLLGFMGISVIAAMMGRAVQQDFEHGTYHFFFSAPIAKRDYVLGRFLGAYLTLLLVFLGVAAGALIGLHWPGVDATRVGPTT
ncbi:MAG TPA: ABC transporter permease subunit, partial [Nevskiaceae bacterium]|nr:ABC transporter permease subunit [Nevskiaceae bacterium]